MRALILTAAMLALAACSKQDQQDNRVAADEAITAENIVANDVTAIDAVTADAANMAAETEIDAAELNIGNDGNSVAPTPSKRAPRPKKPAAEAASNAAGNSAE